MSLKGRDLISEGGSLAERLPAVSESCLTGCLSPDDDRDGGLEPGSDGGAKLALSQLMFPVLVEPMFIGSAPSFGTLFLLGAVDLEPVGADCGGFGAMLRLLC